MVGLPVIISKSISTETGHRLMCHAGKCRHLHGHSYHWTASVIGEVDESTGMVMDFADLKEVMRDCIMVYDHRMLLHEDDPAVELIGHNLGVTTVGFHPTAEMLCKTVALNIAKRLYEILGGVATKFAVSVAVRETETSEAYFAVPVGEALKHLNADEAGTFNGESK